MADKGYRIRDQKAMHFLTFQVVYWIDLFTKAHYCDMLLDTFRFYQREKGLRVHAYVIMTNHIHAILSATQGQNDLSSIVGNFKRYTSRKLSEMVATEMESRKRWMFKLFEHAANSNTKNTKYQVWTQSNHPEECYSYDFTKQKLDYIHDNPVNAGLVDRPDDWVYSSARNYLNKICRLKVDLIHDFVQDE